MLKQKSIDACYISSFDPYLNEYVPLEDCHRYYVTGFNGSMAEALVPASGKVKLYVDGRYHEQADLQVDHSLIEVVKCTKPNTTELLDTLSNSTYNSLALEGSRTALEFYKKLEKVAPQLVVFTHEVESLLNKNLSQEYSPIKLVDSKHRGDGTVVKLKKIFGDKKDEAYYITALDTIAWLTNCRGYHLPFLSSFLGRALVTHDKVHIFVAENIPVDDSAKNEIGLNFIHCSNDGINYQLQQLQHRYQVNHLYFDPGMLNVADYGMLENIFAAAVKAKVGGLVEFQAIKEPGEIAEFISSFDKASVAIYNTIKWVKENVAQGNKISEYDLYQQTSEEYKKQGAITQSFNTISGVGANGSIIHYSDVKKDRIISDQDLVLLDSGGYFEGGFATDTTRTFMGGDKNVDPKFKEMYTLVLKGFVACHSAIFPEGTGGGVLDGLARMPLFKKGLNYAHGTGHGVGIHVHEGGAGITPARNTKMLAGQVVSIEPGYYVPGFGGVRIENVAIVEKHPSYAGFLHFRPLTKVGFEPCLIDQSLLTAEEKQWLDEYEKQCQELGTSFY